MSAMRAILSIIACAIFLSSVAGCVNKDNEIQDSREPELLTLRRENARLKEESTNISTENRVLKSKVAELTIRSEKLDREVADMGFELKQLQKQVKVLADVPEERDRYKAEAEKSKMEMIKLEMELRKTKAKLADLEKTATQPKPGG
jgi:predicted RNase H-like nuclease (RuvC/YqgF family)